MDLKGIYDRINADENECQASTSKQRRVFNFLEGKEDGEDCRGQTSIERGQTSLERGQQMPRMRHSEENLETNVLQLTAGMRSSSSRSQERRNILSLSSFVDISDAEERNLESDSRSSTQRLVKPSQRVLDSSTTKAPAIFTTQRTTLPDDSTQGLQRQERSGSPLRQTGGGVPHKATAEADGRQPEYLYVSDDDPSEGSQATDNNLRNSLPQTDVSSGKPGHYLSLGAPLPILGNDINRPPPARLPVQGSVPPESVRFQANPGAVMRSEATRQPTAQLTIFYSGLINVYDNIPADRAHAIMLLAGTGESLSSNCSSAPLAENSSSRAIAPVATTATAAGATTGTAALSVPVSSAITKSVAYSSTMGIPVSSTSTKAVAYSSSMGMPTSSVTIVPPSTDQRAATRPDAEPSVSRKASFPVARKASLTRFLEKRKDRLFQENHAGKEIEMFTDSQDKSKSSLEKPGSPKRRCSRSPSPSQITRGSRLSSPSYQSTG